MTSITIIRTATSASFLVPSQVPARLNASRTDVLFISPQKGMRRFIRIFFQEFFCDSKSGME